MTKAQNVDMLDWEALWYPVSFCVDVPMNAPMGFHLHDKPLVLFRDESGAIVCLLDRCPHRAARLSDGTIVDGRIECMYHGWQFEAGGRCAHIPQLYPEKTPPARACATAFPVKEHNGLVWVWIGDPEQAGDTSLPSMASSAPDLTQVTFQMDLPYDHSYLIENVIDVAHIHFAHDGVRGGGHRAAAKPLEFHVIKNDAHGISSRFRSVGLQQSQEDLIRKGALVEFEAPYMVRYTTQYAEDGLVSGLELIAVPLGAGKSRLLYRKYSNFISWRERMKPRWLEHMTQRLILEQDMAVIVGQSAEIDTAGIGLKDLWLPIKTSDKLVVAYRKWFDQYGANIPYFRGFTTSSGQAKAAKDLTVQDRRNLHSHICSTCRPIARRLGRACYAMLAGCVGFCAMGLLQPDAAIAWAGLMIISVLFAAGLHRLSKEF